MCRERQTVVTVPKVILDVRKNAITEIKFIVPPSGDAIEHFSTIDIHVE